MSEPGGYLDVIDRLIAERDAALARLAAAETAQDQLVAEFDRDRAMFHAVIGSDGMPLDEARARLALSLADYIDRWMPDFHRGMVLNKSHELHLAQVKEMADDVAALSHENEQAVLGAEPAAEETDDE